MNMNSTPLSLCNSVYGLRFLNIFVINDKICNSICIDNLSKTDNRKGTYNIYRSNDAYSFIAGIYLFMKRMYTFQKYTLKIYE